MIGTRDMAFPRLNAFSYWIFLFAGLFLYSSFLVGHDARTAAGSPTCRSPSTTYSPGLNVDFWALGVVFVGISTTVGAVNFIVTIFKMRAPGMTLNRMPIFVWSMLVFAFMALFAVPAVTSPPDCWSSTASSGPRSSSPRCGGSALLYQHLFWFWGHPEVYILFVPATGMISTIIPVFSRRPIAGYLWIVVVARARSGSSASASGSTTCSPRACRRWRSPFFSAASLVIAIPSGVQFFAWIATMWHGRGPAHHADALRARASC